MVRTPSPPLLRLSVGAVAMVSANRKATGRSSVTRKLVRRLKLSGKRRGASDGRICRSAQCSLTYESMPSFASARTSPASRTDDHSGRRYWFLVPSTSTYARSPLPTLRVVGPAPRGRRHLTVAAHEPRDPIASAPRWRGVPPAEALRRTAHGCGCRRSRRPRSLLGLRAVPLNLR